MLYVCCVFCLCCMCCVLHMHFVYTVDLLHVLFVCDMRVVCVRSLLA